MMGQAHRSSCDKVGELVAAFGVGFREGSCCSGCWAGESFSLLRRGSMVNGTKTCGILVENPITLLLSPRLVRDQPPDSLPLATPP